MVTKIFGLGAVAFALSIFGAGCSVEAASNDATSEDELRSASRFQSCHVDADCVAVPKAGCCQNGWLEAVNKDKTDAYSHSVVCNEMIACPRYVVQDTRVAECNTGTNKCEMVAVDQIACGGFVRNPHKCPDGYSC